MAPKQIANKNTLLKHLASKQVVRLAIRTAKNKFKNAIYEPLKVQQALLRTLTRAVNAVLKEIAENRTDPLHNLAAEQLIAHDNNFAAASAEIASAILTSLLPAGPSPEAIRQLEGGSARLEVAINRVTTRQTRNQTKPEPLPVHDLRKSKRKNTERLKRSVSYPEKTNYSKPNVLRKQHSVQSNTEHSSKPYSEPHHIGIHTATASTSTEPESLMHSAVAAKKHTVKRLLQHTIYTASKAKQGIKQTARETAKKLRSIGLTYQAQQEADEAVNRMTQAVAKISTRHKTAHTAAHAPQTIHANRTQPDQRMVSAQQLRRQRSIGQNSSSVDLQKGGRGR